MNILDYDLLINVTNYLNIIRIIKELNKNNLLINKNELKTYYLFNELEKIEKILKKELNINEFKEIYLYSVWYNFI